MIKAGVSGFVLKDSGRKEIINAIKKISEGEMYFVDNIAQKLIQLKTQSVYPVMDTAENENSNELTKR